MPTKNSRIQARECYWPGPLKGGFCPSFGKSDSERGWKRSIYGHRASSSLILLCPNLYFQGIHNMRSTVVAPDFAKIASQKTVCQGTMFVMPKQMGTKPAYLRGVEKASSFSCRQSGWPRKPHALLSLRCAAAFCLAPWNSNQEHHLGQICLKFLHPLIYMWRNWLPRPDCLGLRNFETVKYSISTVAILPRQILPLGDFQKVGATCQFSSAILYHYELWVSIVLWIPRADVVPLYCEGSNLLRSREMSTNHKWQFHNSSRC